MSKRGSDASSLAPGLAQVDPTHVRYRGKKYLYFGGCDYYRLTWHPALRRAVHRALDEGGWNVAASRTTTGNHPLYAALEGALADFFGSAAAVLAPTGYVANLLAAQALAGDFSHALIDERAHPSLH